MKGFKFTEGVIVTCGDDLLAVEENADVAMGIAQHHTTETGKTTALIGFEVLGTVDLKMSAVFTPTTEPDEVPDGPDPDGACAGCSHWEECTLDTKQ